MPNGMISRQDHDREVDRLASTIARLNAELSALTAYLIASKPRLRQDEHRRAADIAARAGAESWHEAARRIQRIHDAVMLSALAG